MSTITDPALELHSLFQRLDAHETNSQDQTHNVLRQIFTTGSSESDFLDVVSVIVRRIERLKKLVHHANGLDKLHRNSANSTLSQFQSIFTPDRFVSRWQDARAVIQSNGNLHVLHFLSTEIRRIVKYGIPTTEERDEFVRQIDEVLKEPSHMEDVGADVVISALRSLRFILIKLEFFGVEELSEKLGLLSAAYRAIIIRTADPQNPQNLWKRWGQIGAIILAVADVIIVADELPGALQNHYTRAAQIAHWVAEETLPLLPTPERPRLPAPQSGPPDGVLPKNEDDERG